MYCNKCGTRLRKNSNFCHICGNKVSNVEVLIRKKSEPLPNQVQMSDLFEKPEIKIAEPKENKLLNILNAFRVKEDKAQTPLEGDYEVASKLDAKIKPAFKEIETIEVVEVKEIEIESKFEEAKIPEFEIVNHKEKKYKKPKTIDEVPPIEIIDTQLEKETEIEPKRPSFFKRFFEYMREEEVFDQEALDRKSSKGQEVEFESADVQNIVDEEEILESSVNESFLIDTTKLEEEKKSHVLDLEKDSKIELEEDIIPEPKEKKPGFFGKIMSFVKEEDEDNLLDLSPEEYDDLIYGQGDKEDLKEAVQEHELEITEIEKEPKSFSKRFSSFFTPKDRTDLESRELDFDKPIESSPSEVATPIIVDFNESLEVKNVESDLEIDIEEVEKVKAPGIFDSIIGFFSFKNEKDKIDDTKEDYKEDDIDIEEELPESAPVPTYDYMDVDADKTIRYSKTIIDSYLSKAESGELDVEDFDDIEEVPIVEEVKRRSFKDFFGIKDKKEEEIVEEIVEKESIILEKEDSSIEKVIIDESFFIEEDITVEKLDEDIYVDIIVDKPKVKKEEYVYERPEEDLFTPEEPKEKTPGILSNIGDFFKSIPKFFSSSTNGKNETKEKDNIDIILNSPVTSSDTMPLILSSEEKEILNKEIDRRQKASRQEEALKRSNAKVAPIIRKMINLGGKLILPLFIIILAGSCWTISWAVTNPIFIGVLGVIKFVIMYITISVATNAAFNSIGLRLKRSVVTLFIFLQMLVYQILDSIHIKLTFVQGEEALLHVMSPKILTIGVFVILAFLLLLFNYNKIKERKGTLVFLGWYIVISTAITLVIILSELMLSTILITLFKDIMF